MADATGILVFGDAPEGQLASTAQELLAAGRSLADSLGQELTIALLGADVADAPQQAIAHGADKALAVTNPALAEYHPDHYLTAMQAVANESNPGIILIARNNEGRELAPRLAFRLGVGLAQDCLEVSADAGTGRLLANRPCLWWQRRRRGQLHPNASNRRAASQDLRTPRCRCRTDRGCDRVPGGHQPFRCQNPRRRRRQGTSGRVSSWRTPV